MRKNYPSTQLAKYDSTKSPAGRQAVIRGVAAYANYPTYNL